jgi:hypothetical protein
MGLFTKKGKQISFNSLFNRLFDEIYLPSAKYEKYDDPSIRNNIEYGSIYNSVCLLMYYLLSIIVEDFQLIYPAIAVKGALSSTTNTTLQTVVENCLSKEGIDTNFKWHKSGVSAIEASPAANRTYQLRKEPYGEKFNLNSTIKGNDKITTPFYRALYNRPTTKRDSIKAGPDLWSLLYC